MDCKIRRTTDWVTRVTHESQLHLDACFLTLTFSDEGLALRELQRGTHPYDLDVKDWQLFAKRLRKNGAKFRYFQVGEYGDQELRPHYHALIFGEGFRGDGEQWIDDKGHPVWTSDRIEKAWGYGIHTIGEATPETIQYVCKYVQKKLYGQALKNLTERVDSLTGECVTVKPELASMSRGGRTGKGIGHGWWTEYRSDVFPDDFVVIKGKKVPTPRYYSQLLKLEDEPAYNAVLEERKRKAEKRAADNTPERRKVKAQVTKGRVNMKKRGTL